MSNLLKKTIHFLRHGQAMHNINAEPMRAAGCSWDEFIEAMRRDDALDSPLTELGIEQALATKELVKHIQDVELVVPHDAAKGRSCAVSLPDA
jgi:broad specificity phosphatase PhoE